MRGRPGESARSTVHAFISTLTQFDDERERWEALYRADPNSQSFLSWRWLRAFFEHGPAKWRILVVREGEQLVAALPLRLSSAPSRYLPVARELTFASGPVADYQGMLCLPGREQEAIATLAGVVRGMSWDRAVLTDIVDPRVIRLLTLARADGDVLQTTGTTRCVRALLPQSWDAYVKSLSAGTRNTTIRALRKLEADYPGFRVSSPTDADVDRHIEAMVQLNYMRWGGNLRRSRRKYGRLHRAAYDRGCLRLIIIWDGTRPVAGAVSYVDDVRGTYNLYQLGYDAAYGKYSPGKGVIGLAIRDAIDRGCVLFDFLRGYEEYKLAYGSDVVMTTHHRLTRHSVRSTLFSAIQPTYRAIKAAAVRVVYGPGRTI